MKGNRWNFEVTFYVRISTVRCYVCFLWQWRGEQHLSCPSHDVTPFKVFLFITHVNWNVFPCAVFALWGVWWNAVRPEGQHKSTGPRGVIAASCSAVFCCHPLHDQENSDWPAFVSVHNSPPKRSLSLEKRPESGYLLARCVCTLADTDSRTPGAYCLHHQSDHGDRLHDTTSKEDWEN